MEKLIGLIDCDSFFVSCEQAVNPRLKGLPVVVTTGDRGCVVSRSKEAKALGVKMGIPVFMDKKEHSGVVYIRGNKGLYSRISKRVMEIIRNYSPVVEVSSIDEAYIDLTGTERMYKLPPEAIAQKIREEIKEKTDIPVSAGLGLTKTLAKLACDKSKRSNGILHIGKDNLSDVLKDTMIEEVCGIGKACARTLKMLGIFTAADLVATPDTVLKRAAGKTGQDMKYELSGMCVHPVDCRPKPPQSVQDTAALEDFSRDKAVLKRAMRRHIHNSCRRMRLHDGFCTVAGLMLRTKDFHVFMQRRRLPCPTNAESDVCQVLDALLDEMFDPARIYRSVGVTLEGLDYDQDTDLFRCASRHDSKLDKAIDELEMKFGTGIIKRIA